jgi:hypothetical protein
MLDVYYRCLPYIDADVEEDDMPFFSAAVLPIQEGAQHLNYI